MADVQPHPHYRDTLYGYYPTRWITALFVSLFAITTLIHIAQATRYRLWWLFPTMVACGVAEILGWSGRLWSTFGASQFNPYLMQICTTILAPSFMTAANFIILARIIQRLGTEYSRLSPRAYSYIFITADVAALVVQAIGGASASQAAQTGIGDPEKGGKIMLGGIIVQMVAITFYTALAIEFFIRVHSNRPVRSPPIPDSPTPNLIEKQEQEDTNKPLSSDLYRKAHLMLIGLSISTLFIYIRTIYRTIELNDGWTGRIIRNETYFNTLDGMPIVVAMFTINFFHPGFLLPPKPN